MGNSHGMMNIVKIIRNLFVSNIWKTITNQQTNGYRQDNHHQGVVKRDGKSMEVDAMPCLGTKTVTQIIARR